MKRLLLLVSVFSALTCFAHTNDTIAPAKILPQTDTINKHLSDTIDESLYQQRDTALEQKMISNNIDGILRLQSENRAKQKKAAMNRILFGGAMLVVLVIGLMRKRKKPVADNQPKA